MTAANGHEGWLRSFRDRARGRVPLAQRLADADSGPLEAEWGVVAPRARRLRREIGPTGLAWAQTSG